MKKALFSLILLACGMAAIGQDDMYYLAKQYHKVGNAFYHITSDSTVEVGPQQCLDGHCYTWQGNVVIPPTVTIGLQTYTVNRIADEAFLRDGATSLTLHNTIREIGREAFAYSSFRNQISLPDSVQVIEYGAFANMRGSLIEFHIPAGVEHIGEKAFFGTKIYRFVVDSGNRHYVAVDSVALCNSDTTLLLAYAGREIDSQYIVPSSVRRIAEGAFSANRNLFTLILPDGLREIGNSMASDTRLQNLHIPASVCRIEGALRDTASRWFNLTVDPGNRHYKMVDSLLLSFDGDTLLMALGAEGDFSVPRNIRFLGNRLFYNNQKLSTVHLPEDVTAIGNEAFALSSADVRIPSSLQSIGNQAFSENSGTERIAIPNLTYLGDSAFFHSSIKVVDSALALRTINNWAFQLSQLTSFGWGDQLETACEGAFNCCPFDTNTTLTLPPSLRRIGRGAFLTKKNIKAVFLSGPVDTLGTNAFGCAALHFLDPHVPVTYDTPLEFVDTVYTPCGLVDTFEQAIPHLESVVFVESCNPVSITYADPMPGFTLFPNPAREYVTLSLPSLPEGPARVTLRNAIGQELLSLPLASPQLTIPTSSLPAGLYLLTLPSPQGSRSVRLAID